MSPSGLALALAMRGWIASAAGPGARRRGGRLQEVAALGPAIAEHDAAIADAAEVLLHEWASWLRGFAGSSAPFVLERFVRRPGRVRRIGEEVVVVRLERRPLDLVLEMAGYLDELDARAVFGHTLRFELTGP